MAEGLNDEVVGRRLGAVIRGEKRQRKRSIEDVGKGNEGSLGARQVQQQKRSNGLNRGQSS